MGPNRADTPAVGQSDRGTSESGRDRANALLAGTLMLAAVLVLGAGAFVLAPTGGDGTTAQPPTEQDVRTLEEGIERALVERRGAFTGQEGEPGVSAYRGEMPPLDPDAVDALLRSEPFTAGQRARTVEFLLSLAGRDGPAGSLASLEPTAETRTGVLVRGGTDEPLSFGDGPSTLASGVRHVQDTVLSLETNSLPLGEQNATEVSLVGIEVRAWQELGEPGVVFYEIEDAGGAVTDGPASRETERLVLDVPADTVNGDPVSEHDGNSTGGLHHERDPQGTGGVVTLEHVGDEHTPNGGGVRGALNVVVGADESGALSVDPPGDARTRRVVTRGSFEATYLDESTTTTEYVDIGTEYRAFDPAEGTVPPPAADYRIAVETAPEERDDFRFVSVTAPASDDFLFYNATIHDTAYEYRVERVTGSSVVDVTDEVQALRLYGFSGEMLETTTGRLEPCATPDDSGGCASIEAPTASNPTVTLHEDRRWVTIQAVLDTGGGDRRLVNRTVAGGEPYTTELFLQDGTRSIEGYGEGLLANETHDLGLLLRSSVNHVGTIREVGESPETTYEVVDGERFVDRIDGATLRPNASAFDDRVGAEITVRGVYEGYDGRTYSDTLEATLVDPFEIDRFEVAFDVESALTQTARTDAAGARVFRAFRNVSDDDRVNGPPLPVPTEGDAFDMQPDAELPVPIEVVAVTADGKRLAADADALQGVDDIALTLENRGIDHTLDRSALAADGYDDALLPETFGEIRTIGGEPQYVPDRDTYSAGEDITDASEYVGSLVTAEEFAESLDGTEYFNETALDSTDRFPSPESMDSRDLLPADIRIDGTIDVDYTDGTTETYTDRAQRPAHAFTYDGFVTGGGQFSIEENPTGTVPPDQKFSGNGTIFRAGVSYTLETPVGDSDTAAVGVPQATLPQALLTGPYSSNPYWSSPRPGLVKMTGDAGWHGGGPTTGWEPVSFPAFVDESYAAGLFDGPGGSASIASDDVPASVYRYTTDPPEPGGEDPSASPSLLIAGVGDSFKSSHQFGDCSLGPSPTCAPQVPGIGTMTVTEGDELLFRVWDSGVLQNVPDRSLRWGLVGHRREPDCRNQGGCTVSRQAHADLTGTEQTASLDSWLAELNLESFGTGYSSGLPGAPRVADFTALEPATGDVTFTTDTGEETEIQVEVVPKDEGGI